jgi:hypothetical protein
MAIVDIKQFDDYILQAEILSGTYDWNGSASSVLIGAADTLTGEFNSELISLSQGASGSANDVCLTHVSSGYNDWYLPSNDELTAIYQKGILNTSNSYWSSTELNTNNAYIIIGSNGLLTDNLKGFGTFNVVAVRKEYTSDYVTIERMNVQSKQAPILRGGENNADEDAYKMLGGVNGISKNSNILTNE